MVQYISRVKGSKKNSHTLQTLKSEGTVLLSKCQEQLNQQQCHISEALTQSFITTARHLSRSQPRFIQSTQLRHIYCKCQPDPGNSVVFTVKVRTPTLRHHHHDVPITTVTIRMSSHINSPLKSSHYILYKTSSCNTHNSF